MKRFIISLAASILVFGASLASQAITLNGETINFDDFNLPGSAALIPSGYHGFNWNNFIIYQVPAGAIGGYGTGLLSPNNEIYSITVTDQTITRANVGEEFSFTEIWATAAMNNTNLDLYIEGRKNGQFVISDLISLNTSGPTYMNYAGTAFEDIDELYFEGQVNGMGYIDNPTADIFQYQFVLDAPTPEPSSMLLGFLGLSSLVGFRRKQK
jgi:hypothetical protein